MAENVYVRTPDAMNVGGGNPSAAWDKRKLKFQVFLQATGANGKQDTVKVGLLLNHIGDEGIDVFISSSHTFRKDRILMTRTDDFQLKVKTTTRQ